MPVRAGICFCIECDNCGMSSTEIYLDYKALEESALNLGWEQASDNKWLCPMCVMPEPDYDPIDNFGYNPF